MYALTLDGLDDAMRELTRKQGEAARIRIDPIADVASVQLRPDEA